MKRLKNLFCLLLLWIGIPTGLRAEHVPLDQAKKWAVAFFQQHAPSRATDGATLQLVYDGESPASRSQGAQPTYYVFNHTGGKGFVIVSGEDTVTPLLGYSFEYPFRTKDLPANLQVWLDGLRRQIQHVRRQPHPASRSITQAWQKIQAGQPVVLIQTALWDQEEPYWDYCPTYQGQQTYSGCTATALAILMRHYQWPEKGTGTLPGYQTDTYKLTILDRKLGHTYQWDQMPLQLNLYTLTPEERHQIATLIYDCGVMLRSDYTTYGTGATIYNAPKKLIENFDYDRSMNVKERKNYTTQQWYRMLKTELNQHNPILYAGFGYYPYTDGGHAFILEGYTTDDFFAVNWGWSGYCNGYYHLDTMIPTDTGTGGGNGDYSYYQVALLGVQKNQGLPPESFLEYVPYRLDNGSTLYGLYTTETEFRKDQTFQISAGFVNNSGFDTFYGEVAFGILGTNGQLRPESILQQNHTPLIFHFSQGLPPNYGSHFLDYPVNLPVEPQRGEKLCMFYKEPDNSAWKVIQGNEAKGCTWAIPLREGIDPLDKCTSLRYSKLSHEWTVKAPADTRIQLLGPDLQEVHEGLSIQGTEAIIRLQKLPTGNYRLKLTRGAEVREITLIEKK